MSNEQQTKHFGDLSVLLRAPEALKNTQALIILAVTFMAVGLMIKFGIYLFSAFTTAYVGPITGSIALLGAALIAAAGFSGAGILLMDQARNIEMRSLTDAFIAGLLSVAKVVVIFLLDGLAVVALCLAALLVLLICKIPGLGPILYTIAFPLLVLASGGIIAAVVFVIVPMTLPAIWEGNTVKGVYARRWSLAQSRFVQIVVGLLLLSLVAGLVAVLINVVLGAGFGITAALSALVLHFQANFGSFMGSYGSYGGNDGAESGYLIAATIGGGLLLMVGMSIPALVYMFGANLVYLANCEGLDFSAAEQTIGRRMESAKRRGEELKARAAEASQRARNAAQAPSASKSE